ncbi:MAG: IgA Peptidase M64 [Prevotellaceae bacterium]|nr:IgA Peptidase M64 [Prevotellaceae bacterium]
MKHLLLTLLLCSTLPLMAQFDEHFTDRTLRVNYIFSGDNRHQQIHLSELLQSPGWYGRRVNLTRLQLKGNGQIVMTDTLGRDTLYCHSFSSLFQEWQTTEEATRVNKAFENSFLLPFPKEKCKVTITLTDTHNKVSSRLEHVVDPSDILIRRTGERGVTPWRYIRQGGSSEECIDIAFVAEGYREEEMELFYRDCERAVEAILSHEPFKSEQGRLNFVAVACPSEESGVSVPREGLWVNTALGSHYDTFYTARYNTISGVFHLYDLLSGIPFEHIIALVNTERYGGGGIYNSYLLASAHHETMAPVTVHEFGHSFGGLGDEYFYDDQFETQYPTDAEPWEPNLTTLVDFQSKWQDMLPEGTPVPTPADGEDVYTRVGVYEGGGYQSKGVYRPAQECRMKINEAPVFCPVCERAIRRVIRYYTEEQ